MRFDDHGSFAAGDAIRVKVKARGGATGGGSRLAFAGAASASSATVTGATWQDLTLTATLPAAGSLSLQLMAEGTVDQQGFFDDVQVSKLPPALTSTGQPNLWPDPGFEYVLGTGGGVSASAGVTIEPQTTTLREGLHGLRIASGTYSRTISGLDATKNYLFSIWKNPGTGWVRETRRTLPATGGSLTVALSQAGLYDLAELMVDTGQTLPEAWIPENRLGRVDWFITDHLGSTKLLIDQNGQHRFTGDDDPFGINLRSFGDKDTRRYTGQILDEEQGVYYYGARYYLPEIGRFLSGDPAKQFSSLFMYAGNSPTMRVDPSGMWSPWETGIPELVEMDRELGMAPMPEITSGSFYTIQVRDLSNTDWNSLGYNAQARFVKETYSSYSDPILGIYNSTYDISTAFVLPINTIETFPGATAPENGWYKTKLRDHQGNPEMPTIQLLTLSGSSTLPSYSVNNAPRKISGNNFGHYRITGSNVHPPNPFPKDGLHAWARGHLMEIGRPSKSSTGCQNLPPIWWGKMAVDWAREAIIGGNNVYYDLQTTSNTRQ